MFMIPMGDWVRRHLPWQNECIVGSWRGVPWRPCY
nr:MAG TPA: hypothetical protein [Caudoviricetes sp.]